MADRHPLPNPMCQECNRQSGVFRVDEGPKFRRRLLICAECLCNRELLWERFGIAAVVEPLDRHEKSS